MVSGMLCLFLDNSGSGVDGAVLGQQGWPLSHGEKTPAKLIHYIVIYFHNHRCFDLVRLRLLVAVAQV